ncbi:MAG: acetaldehyde dehydrogenase (acetylating) [Oscillospiraceae bacterium]|nr:acetaldehyde dehydrogenase (acetylating) [Oscillospiraceae bacterium]
MELGRDLKSRQEVRELVEKSSKAQEILRKKSQAEIDRIIKAIADCGVAHAEELARLAQEETGFGNVKDKIQKNLFASKTVYEAIRDQKTIGILHKDTERKVWDVGVPVGVVAGIAPSTNPTSTVLYKSLIALKGGNTIVFSPHPGAAKCTLKTVEYLMEAAEQAGCPAGAVSCITIPTMDAIEELMKHPQVKLILATGGEAMVRAAYSSGKPAIGVGAGNGPAYLHPSCHLKDAIEKIFRSKTFDNGTICASEQSIIYHKNMEKEVFSAIEAQGGCVLEGEEAEKLSRWILRCNGTMNPKIVGKTASEIAKMASLGEKAQKAKVLLAREDMVGDEHPFSREKLCPILALYAVENEEEALRLSCEILYHEGSGHTFAIHAEDGSVVEKFALQVPVSRFLVNTPSALGGIGASTGLFPALTLGCGAVGGSSSSNNIGPLDLINIRRVAWDTEKQVPKEHVASVDEELIEKITEKILEKFR